VFAHHDIKLYNDLNNIQMIRNMFNQIKVQLFTNGEIIAFTNRRDKCKWFCGKQNIELAYETRYVFET